MLQDIIRSTAFHAGSAAAGRIAHSRRVFEAQALLRQHFSPHVLRVLGSPSEFRAELHWADFGEMGVSTLSYNAAVELEVYTAVDQLLVTTQLRGEESVSSRGNHRTGGFGFVVLDSTPGPVTKCFSADSCRLNLRLKRSALDRLWHQVVHPHEPAPVAFEPFLDDGAQQRWQSYMQLLLGYLQAPPRGGVSPHTMKRLEEAIMLFLLLEHRHDATDRLTTPPALGDKRLQKAEEYVRGHLREPLILSDIAQAAGASIRALTAAFRLRHGTSPMKFVEQLRLEAAHAALTRGEGASVTDVATEFCFSNLGRFAAAYRARFGASPSEVKRTSKRTASSGI